MAALFAVGDLPVVTNEELRKEARKRLGGRQDISIPEWGVVQRTENYAFVEAVVEIPLNGMAFKEFRADGWPLCPKCGDDELFSLSVPATIETIEGCYFCRWSPSAQADGSGE